MRVNNSQGLLQFSRLQLAQLGREYMLCSRFNSCRGYAALRINHGDAAYKDIDEVDETAVEPLSVQIAKVTVLYQTRLQDYIQLLQV